MRYSLEDDPDFDQNLLARIERSTITDLIDAQRRIVKIKEAEWKQNSWPPPDDDMLNEWVTEARKKQTAARDLVHKKYTRPFKPGETIIVAAPDEEEGT
jgi:hypothetical protein